MISGKNTANTECSNNSCPQHFRSFHHGFTLIELMVTVALIGLLALISMPFTSDWTASQRINETQTLLQHAIQTAKARAMKNEKGLSDTPIAVICVVDDVGRRLLQVRQLNDSVGSADPCNAAALAGTSPLATTLWESTINGGVELQHDSTGSPTDLSYIYFDNRGSVVADAGVCSTSDCLQPGKEVQVASKSANVKELKVSVF